MVVSGVLGNRAWQRVGFEHNIVCECYFGVLSIMDKRRGRHIDTPSGIALVASAAVLGFQPHATSTYEESFVHVFVDELDKVGIRTGRTLTGTELMNR